MLKQLKQLWIVINNNLLTSKVVRVKIKINLTKILICDIQLFKQIDLEIRDKYKQKYFKIYFWLIKKLMTSLKITSNNMI